MKKVARFLVVLLFAATLSTCTVYAATSGNSVVKATGTTGVTDGTSATYNTEAGEMEQTNYVFYENKSTWATQTIQYYQVKTQRKVFLGWSDLDSRFTYTYDVNRRVLPNSSGTYGRTEKQSISLSYSGNYRWHAMFVYSSNVSTNPVEFTCHINYNVS